MKSVQNRVYAILDNTTEQDLNSWEKKFLRSLKEMETTKLSEKQEACLKKIEDKLKMETEDEDEPLDDSIPF